MDLASLAVGMGSGALIGFIIGYALRKMLALALFAIGVFLVGLMFLVSNGIATVDFGALQKMLMDLFVFGLKTGNEAIDQAFSGTPFTFGLMAGLGLGLFRSGGLGFLALRTCRRRVLRRAEGE